MERIDLGGLAMEALIAGEGPPLLFLHGSDYVAQNRPFLDRLAARFRVIAPRHAGFGGSERPAWFRTVHDIAYAHLDLLDRLALDHVVVVGSSFGGWVALEMAVRSTARMKRLVLIDSLGVRFGEREQRDITDVYALSADEAARRIFADPAGHVPDYAALDDATLRAVAADREASVLYGWKPFMHDPALRHWLHRVRVPSLVLWGEADGIVAPSYGERLAAAIPGARLTTIAGAGHYPQIEQPDAVAAAITRFVEG